MSVRASASLPFELLGRHVLERAEDRALRRQRRLIVGSVGRLAPRRRRRLARLRQAEVEQLRARLRQHDVAGLQIAVDDAAAVRLVERVGDLDRVCAAPVERQRALRQPIAPASRLRDTP